MILKANNVNKPKSFSTLFLHTLKRFNDCLQRHFPSSRDIPKTFENTLTDDEC